MSCRRHREEIRGAALGEPLPARAREHLRGCVACRERLERGRWLAERLESELQSFASGDVPPQLVTRVRARLRSQPESAAPGRTWLPVALAAGLLAAVVALLGRGAPDTRHPPPRPEAVRHPDVVRGDEHDQPDEDVAAADRAPEPEARPRRGAAPPPLATTSGPPPGRVAPEVLIPARDREAWRRFAARRHLWSLAPEPVAAREGEPSVARWSAPDWELPETADDARQWELESWPLLPGDETNGGEGP